MKFRTIGSIVFSLILLAGISACKHEVTATGELTPEQLANVGARIYVHPENQTAILSDAGMTESDFRLQIENISTNMDASSRYRKEFEQQLQNYHK
jgi:hypothetical protein